MMQTWLVGLSVVASVGCGLIAGVFFAFSTFVMTALRRLPAGQGIAAMQAINVAVVNPAFLAVFLGTAASCAVVIVAAPMRWAQPGAGYLMGGAALYFVGTVLVTMLFNVPLNNVLAKVAPGDADAGDVWTRYVSRWTMWNHVRTAAAALAMAAFIFALRAR
jgi:uncharacterized membrane protein